MRAHPACDDSNNADDQRGANDDAHGLRETQAEGKERRASHPR